MRRARIVKGITAKGLTTAATGLPYVLTMVDYLDSFVFADAAWSEGTDNEAASKLAACLRLQDVFEDAKEGVTVKMFDGDWELLSKIVRSKSHLPESLRALASKEKRFQSAIVGAEFVKDEQEQKPSKNGKPAQLPEPAPEADPPAAA